MTVRLPRPRAVVTDIEGTTTPIAFVKDVLFPFARDRLSTFVRHHAKERTVAQALAATAAIATLPANDHDELITTLIAWIDEDRKAPPLKTLQGMIWEEGYRSGVLHGPIFPDAAAQLRRWARDKIILAVYSSGSVLAQKLLFGASDQGDLTPLFSAFFDTAIGGKRESAPYHRIADHLSLPTETILFLSDVTEELDAAKTTGMMTVHLVRPGEGAIPTARHPAVDSFTAITFIEG